MQLALQIIAAVIGLACLSVALLNLFFPIPQISDFFLKSKESWSSPTPVPVGVLCLIGWGVFFYSGLLKFFWFIPKDWGTYGEDGRWTNTAEFLAGMFGFCLALGFVQKLENFHMLKARAALLEEEVTSLRKGQK